MPSDFRASETGHLITGAAFLKMSNTLNFSSNKRLSSQFLISHRLSKKGQASIFNLMPLLPPQQTPNKQYLSIIVSKFVMEGSGHNHKQRSPTASTDFIQRKGNDKVKCLTYRAARAKMEYFCLQASTISQYKIYYGAFVAANRHLSFFYCLKFQALSYVILPTSKPKTFINK